MRRRLLVALAFAGLVFALITSPLHPRGLVSHPRPARSYDEALRLVDSLRADDSPAISTECATELLTHGQRTARVVVLLHGLTNCPAQFDSIAGIVYAMGANVLVPRLPHHGFANRMTGDLANLEANELCAFTDRVLDAAAGLGDSVTVAGLSVGGVMAAWAGQERADVDRAVVIAPMISWALAPGPLLTSALVRIGNALPNRFVWWDDRQKQDLAGSAHAYPRFASRAVAATMLMGAAVRADAARRAPAAHSLVMITVGGDTAADNGAAAALVSRWRLRGSSEVHAYEFPEKLHLNHDIVDPQQIGGNPALTYPVLVALILPGR